MNVEDLKCATSETTDYIAVVKDQAVYGDKVLSIDECVNSYISERSDGNGSSYRHSYYDGPYMYTIVERIVSRKSLTLAIAGDFAGD